MEIVPDDPSKLTTINNKNHDTLQKKKKRKRNTSSTSISNGCCGFLDEDVVVHEILTRLPVKSLIRFKSVCKQWSSVIPPRNPNLLIIVPSPEKPLYGDRRPDYVILTGEIERCRGRTTEEVALASIIDSTIKTTLSFFPDIITNCINGFVCFIDSKFKHNPCLYNINTGEETPLFMSPLLKQEKRRSRRLYHSASQLGLDPVTNEIKLVWVWNCRDHSRKFIQFCEVLTVVGGCRNNENNSWRTINQVDVNVGIVDPCVHVYGTIYWSSFNLRHLNTRSCNVFMVAFDVGSEKFRYIGVPKFKIDKSRKPSRDTKLSDPSIDLLEVGGRVALKIKINCHTIKLCILDDDDKKGITTMTSAKNWSQVTINLPLYWKKHPYQLHTIFDQIVLRTYEYKDLYGFYEANDTENKQNLFLHSFDLRKNILTKFDIGGIPSWIPLWHIHHYAFFRTFFKSV